MNDFVKRMIIEHKELCEKIDKLNEIVYNQDNPIHKQTNKYDYANMCMQLMSMKNYARALECRLDNQGVYVDTDGDYVEKLKVDTPKVVDYFVGVDLTSPVEKNNDRPHNDDIDMKK